MRLLCVLVNAKGFYWDMLHFMLFGRDFVLSLLVEDCDYVHSFSLFVKMLDYCLYSHNLFS